MSEALDYTQWDDSEEAGDSEPDRPDLQLLQGGLAQKTSELIITPEMRRLLPPGALGRDVVVDFALKRSDLTWEQVRGIGAIVASARLPFYNPAALNSPWTHGL